jgi:hypothetical protein
MTPEGRVKEDCKRLLKSFDIWYYMPVQNGMGVVGIPDIIACWKGRFLAIETKAPGKRNNTTENQKRVLKEIGAHGGLQIVVDDVEQLLQYLSTESLNG